MVGGSPQSGVGARRGRQGAAAMGQEPCPRGWPRAPAGPQAPRLPQEHEFWTGLQDWRATGWAQSRKCVGPCAGRSHIGYVAQP